MNILVTSASRKVNLVRSFQAALAQEGGGKVIAVDINPNAPALYIADDHYLVRRSSEPGFLDEILRICRNLDIKLLIPTRDEELPFFAQYKQEFIQAGTTVMVPEKEIVNICQDKVRFLDFCCQNGFDIPRRIDLASVKKSFQPPLFVKPRIGKGGSLTFRIDSLEDLENAIKSVSEPIVQEFIDAPEYTVDIFADFEKNIISVVPRQRVEILNGESIVGVTVDSQELIHEVVRMSTALGLVGHNTIQCFFDKQSVKFIEINPRYGGGANLGFASGANTPLYLIQLMKGKKIRPLIGNYRSGLVMLRYSDDLFLEIKDISLRRFS